MALSLDVLFLSRCIAFPLSPSLGRSLVHLTAFVVKFSQVLGTTKIKAVSMFAYKMCDCLNAFDYYTIRLGMRPASIPKENSRKKLNERVYLAQCNRSIVSCLRLIQSRSPLTVPTQRTQSARSNIKLYNCLSLVWGAVYLLRETYANVINAHDILVWWSATLFVEESTSGSFVVARHCVELTRSWKCRWFPEGTAKE